MCMRALINTLHDFYLVLFILARTQTFLLSFLVPQNSFHIHSMNMCVWVNGKKGSKSCFVQNGKRKMRIFVRNVWIWYEVKESWKHIENERWTVCVLVVCVRIWYSDKKYKSFSQENSAKHHVPCFRSLLVLFCHFVYDIYNSLLVGWCILSCFCGSSPRFHVHITLNGKVHMITITQTRVWCNCIYMIWCA